MGLLGFTFGFGARDDGMASSLAAGRAQVKALNSQMDSLGETAKNTRLSAIFDGFNAMNLSKVSTELERITGGAQQVTTGLESTMASYNKEARVFVAQTGLTGKAAAAARSKISGLAYSMNIGAGQVGKGWQAIEMQGASIKTAFKEAGLGLKDFLRAEEATGVTSDIMVNNLSSLVKSYGFTGKEAGKFLDKFTAVTLAGGQTAVAFTNMKSTLAELDEALVSSQYYKPKDPEAQRKYVEETMLGMQSLAGMIYKTLGGDPADAQEAAKKFTTELMHSMSQLTSTLSGSAGAEISDLIKSIAGEAGDFDLATQLVGKTPDQAFKVLMDLQGKLQASSDKNKTPEQMVRFNDIMQKVLPNFGFLSKMSVKTMDDIGAAANKSSNAFKKLGKEAFTTGFTLQELLDRAKDQFDTRLGSIYGGIGDFVSAQKLAYKETINMVSDMASDATWGPLAKQFVGAARIGLSAFFIPVRLNAEQAKNRIENLSEAVSEGGLMGKFKAIQQLGVAGVFFDASRATTDMAGAVGAAEQVTLKWYGKLKIASIILEKFQPVIMSVGGALFGVFGVFKMLTPVIGGVASAFRGLGSSIAGIIGWPATIFLGLVSMIVLWQKMPDKFKESADKVMKKARDFAKNLTGAIAKIDSKKISGAITSALRGAALAIKSFLTGESFASDGSTASQLGAALGSLFIQAFTVVKDVLMDVLKTMWEDKDIRKYLTIPLGVAFLGSKALSAAGSIGTAIAGTAMDVLMNRMRFGVPTPAAGGGAASVVGCAAAAAGNNSNTVANALGGLAGNVPVSAPPPLSRTEQLKASINAQSATARKPLGGLAAAEASIAAKETAIAMEVAADTSMAAASAASSAASAATEAAFDASRASKNAASTAEKAVKSMSNATKSPLARLSAMESVIAAEVASEGAMKAAQNVANASKVVQNASGTFGNAMSQATVDAAMEAAGAASTAATAARNAANSALNGVTTVTDMAKKPLGRLAAMETVIAAEVASEAAASAAASAFERTANFKPSKAVDAVGFVSKKPLKALAGAEAKIAAEVLATAVGGVVAAEVGGAIAGTTAATTALAGATVAAAEGAALAAGATVVAAEGAVVAAGATAAATTAVTGTATAAGGLGLMGTIGAIVAQVIAAIGTGGISLIVTGAVAAVAAVGLGMKDNKKEEKKVASAENAYNVDLSGMSYDEMSPDQKKFWDESQQRLKDLKNNEKFAVQQTGVNFGVAIMDMNKAIHAWYDNLMTSLGDMLGGAFSFNMTKWVQDWVGGLLGPKGALSTIDWLEIGKGFLEIVWGIIATLLSLVGSLVGIVIDLIGAIVVGALGLVSGLIFSFGRDLMIGVIKSLTWVGNKVLDGWYWLKEKMGGGKTEQKDRTKISFEDYGLGSEQDIRKEAGVYGEAAAQAFGSGYVDGIKKETISNENKAAVGTADFFEQQLKVGADKSASQYQTLQDQSISSLARSGLLGDVQLGEMQRRYASDAKLLAESLGVYNEDMGRSIMEGRELAVRNALTQGRDLGEAMDEYSKTIADKLAKMKADAEATYRDTWNLDYNQSSVGDNGEQVRRQIGEGNVVTFSDQSSVGTAREFIGLESMDYRDPSQQMSNIGDQPPIDPALAARDALAGGAEIVGATAKGIKVGAPAVVNAMKATQQNLVDIMPQKGVPIAANVPFAKLPNMGKEIMHQIAIGMYDGAYLMTDAFTEALNNLSLSVVASFTAMGTSASNAFRDGVIGEQEADIQFIHTKLSVLFDSMYSKITIKDVNNEQGSATISVDSIGGLREEVKKQGERTARLLVAIGDNTYYTAINTGKTAGTKASDMKVSTGGAVL